MCSRRVGTSSIKNKGSGKWETELGSQRPKQMKNMCDILGVKKRNQSRQEPWEYWHWVVKESKLEVMGKMLRMK